MNRWCVRPRSWRQVVLNVVVASSWFAITFHKLCYINNNNNNNNNSNSNSSSVNTTDASKLSSFLSYGSVSPGRRPLGRPSTPGRMHQSTFNQFVCPLPNIRQTPPVLNIHRRRSEAPSDPVRFIGRPCEEMKRPFQICRSSFRIRIEFRSQHFFFKIQDQIQHHIWDWIKDRAQDPI